LDFNPCMKHKTIRKVVRNFAEAELGSIAHDIDRDARFPEEVIELLMIGRALSPQLQIFF